MSNPLNSVDGGVNGRMNRRGPRFRFVGGQVQADGRKPEAHGHQNVSNIDLKQKCHQNVSNINLKQKCQQNFMNHSRTQGIREFRYRVFVRDRECLKKVSSFQEVIKK